MMFKRKNSCPVCSMESGKWKGERNLFMCPSCSTVFSEFGIISSGEAKEVDLA